MEYARITPYSLDYSIAIVFFIGYYFFCFVIMLNLFLLVIIMQYDEFYQKVENPIEKFENMARVFKKSWSKFIEKDGDSHRIKSYNIKRFIESLLENRIKEGLPKQDLLVSSKKVYIFKLNLLQ